MSTGLKTDGNVRIDAVPPQLDLASAHPDVDTLEVRAESVRTVEERADEPEKTVAAESSTGKNLSGDKPTMRTTHGDPCCEEGGGFWEQHQVSTVSRSATENRRLPASQWTRMIKTLIAGASKLNRENEDAWQGLMKTQRPDLCELCHHHQTL